MNKIETKRFSKPDETRTFPKGKLELIKLGGLTVGKVRFEPGWKWSESLGPIAKTKSCLQAHNLYVLSGRNRVRMDDGTELEFGPGEFVTIPPGHDGWVVGNEPFEAIDVTGMENYALRAKSKAA
jgi:hypothetical protein